LAYQSYPAKRLHQLRFIDGFLFLSLELVYYEQIADRQTNRRTGKARYAAH